MSDQNKQPDFYLASTECIGDLAQVRACWIRGRLSDKFRNDYMWINVSPPVIGQQFGLGDQDLHDLLIATRHSGFTLFPISEWPSYVFICQIISRKILTESKFTEKDIEMIAWGEIYRNQQEADKAIMSSVSF